MASLPYSTTLNIPFESANLASVAQNALQVDQEISTGKVSRTIATNGKELVVTFDAESLRMLRVGLNGFMDSLILVTRTLDTFA
ncbi:hypothetical protein IW140_000616 [Coemansia sp. RSA 1813]|nr:hypothetical protein EV178_003321 [Coemansia sp. RSA 1646]KAJ1774085.1 hypothetical protein LPJ74_000184 [Coemansia sp. RSA 1843]KAJ2092524.1 hypothetical protein IW138_000962 [Coemansia sp. RSA 986]KAJ2216781.1 hypothetical protein EV179_001071 [Coemansia sp. RSA 487]KAJ2572853.1 hypothetical protein IW140_000616 [Coemansia sp. RSA 1813]